MPTRTRCAAIEPGAILANTYRIEEPLGTGGMGAVFAARHLRTGRRYAVKTILRGDRAGEGEVRRFEREATAASALGHPGIVQVHDFDVAPGGTFYLVMDLLEGETLADRLQRGPLSWPEAQRIALELCSALGAAHEHGLLHRDIKPSNVFLAKSKGAVERSVLVDFGLVKSLTEKSNKVTSTGAVVGTPMYMSPEQARGERSTCARTSTASPPSSSRCSPARRPSAIATWPRSREALERARAARIASRAPPDPARRRRRARTRAREGSQRASFRRTRAPRCARDDRGGRAVDRAHDELLGTRSDAASTTLRRGVRDPAGQGWIPRGSPRRAVFTANLHVAYM